MEHVSPAYGANWKSIGLHLGIQSGSLQIIEHDNHHKALNCCNAMFTEWLDVDGSASWGKLKKALRSIIATTAKELTPAIHNGKSIVQVLGNLCILSLIRDHRKK